MYSEKEYLGLMNLLYDCFQSLKGVNPKDHRLLQMRPLVLKVIFHAGSAHVLWRDRTNIPEVAKSSSTEGASFLDPASIHVIARAALETYLMFFYIFAEPEIPSDLFTFRYSAWQLEGLLWRKAQNLNPREVGRIRQLLREDDEIQKFRNTIEKTNQFSSLKSKQQKDILSGKRWREGWISIAEKARINQAIGKKMYSYMSQFAHSTSLSGWQLIDAQSLQEQQEVARLPLFFIEIALAKFITDMDKLFPANAELRVNYTEPWRLAEVISGMAEQFPFRE